MVHDALMDEEVERRLTLRDGSPVLVRRIRPDDGPRLEEGLTRLSPLSRYRRFHALVERLSTKHLAYLTRVDGQDHMAWIAVDPLEPRQPALGVARCIRSAEDPAVAEVAVTVVDSHQGRGLGTLLLALLAAWAREHAITTFRALVLRDNEPMLELLRELEARPGSSDDPEVLCLDVPVPADTDHLPDTPAGRVFRAIASSSA